MTLDIRSEAFWELPKVEQELRLGNHPEGRSPNIERHPTGPPPPTYNPPTFPLSP